MKGFEIIVRQQGGKPVREDIELHLVMPQVMFALLLQISRRPNQPHICRKQQPQEPPEA